MKKRLSTIFLMAGLIQSSGALATERTVNFTVENMTCASCPYIVKQSMAAVPGVARVQVSLRTQSAIVTFDDAKTTAATIAAASAKAGFPATPSPQGS